MGDGIVCDTNLALTIGCYGDHVVNKRAKKDDIKKCVSYLDLSLKTQGRDPIDYMEEESNSFIIYENGKRSSMNSSDDSNKDGDEDVNNKNNGARNKLRLTREQTNFLEERFKHDPIINSIQKHAIAAKLNLKPRQVEVWFQNRRARTKLKQIEVDYEFMKKWCDSLSDENRRLKRELQELRSSKINQQTSPLFLQFSKAKNTSSSEKFMRKKENA